MNLTHLMSMDVSSCLNALRCFFALRHPAKQLPSNCGTNFTRAWNAQMLEWTKWYRHISVGLQPPTCLSYGRLLGVNNQHSQKDPGFNVSPAKHSSNLQIALHTNGRGHSHHECMTTPPCVSRPWKTLHTLTINAPYTENRSSTWKLLGQGPAYTAMEIGSGSCKLVLDLLELWILTFFATQTEVDSASQKPSIWRASSAQGQAVCLKLLAHVQDHCDLPRKGWICKKGQSENNWPRQCNLVY